MLFSGAEPKSEFTEEIEDNPQKNTDPKVQQKSPVECEKLMMKNVRQAIFENIVNGVAANDGHEDLGEFADNYFHELKEAGPESIDAELPRKVPKPEFLQRSSGSSFKRSRAIGPWSKTAISEDVCYHTRLRIG